MHYSIDSIQAFHMSVDAHGVCLMFERLTDAAHKVMQLAAEEAKRVRHEWIGTEHVLLGILRLHEEVPQQIVDALGLRPESIRAAVEQMMIHASVNAPLTELRPTPRTKRVLTFAADEARTAGSEQVGVEHLLAGLVLEIEGLAALALTPCGITIEGVRACIASGLRPLPLPLRPPRGQLRVLHADPTKPADQRRDDMLKEIAQLTTGLGISTVAVFYDSKPEAS
jgi:ATP-dependent Clp protease ATP-binding subunit ClpA